MCLGVPGRIAEIRNQDGLRFGRVDFGGVSREVCLDYVPEGIVGDYCIVHVGFAISLLSEAEAQQTLSTLQQIAEIAEGTAVASDDMRCQEPRSSRLAPEGSGR